MKKRVGILTSGGDCPGLNATIRGVAKALDQRMGDDLEIIGIINGYYGLINGDWRVMQREEFSGITPWAAPSWAPSAPPSSSCGWWARTRWTRWTP